jgi:hypothetical protein
MWRMVIFLLLIPTLAFAAFTDHKAITLDALFAEWDNITKNEDPGVSLTPPQKVKFTATLQSLPVPCSTATLEIVLRMMNFADLLKQISVTHCFGFTSSKGRNVVAYVQDVLVPGLKSDAKIGRSIEIYADFLAYGVKEDRSRNFPIFLVSRFEPL